jgi:hypothetical protein
MNSMRKNFPENFVRHLLLFLLANSISLYASSQSAELFSSDEILEFTLSCDMKALMKDRDVKSDYHQAIVKYDQDGEAFEIPLKIKTRGHFRKMRENCNYPPIRLNFAKATTPENSIFKDQDKTKLVTPCRGEEYVIQEYLVYKLYNLITPLSFKARLVKVVYHDNVKDKSTDPLFGILLEEEKQLAKRNNMEAIEKYQLKPKNLRKEEFLKFAVFQYMIGNTDWGIEYMQNIKYLKNDDNVIPHLVPYDFDHAGIVRAPYANPAPELKLSTTLQRRYRGYCIEDMNEFQEVFQTFISLKDEFYAIYEDNPLLDEKYIKRTIKFLDDFYEIINDPKKAERYFTYPCDPFGTGNVIIRGLREID